jgi:hypothetical protein
MQNILGGVLLIAALFTLIMTFTSKGKNIPLAAIATAILAILALLAFFVDPSSVAGQ